MMHAGPTPYRPDNQARKPSRGRRGLLAEKFAKPTRHGKAPKTLGTMSHPGPGVKKAIQPDGIKYGFGNRGPRKSRFSSRTQF